MNLKHHEAGRAWFEENYESAKLSANRWFVSCIASLFACSLLTISLIVLLPLKTLIPLVIHQNSITGEVWVTHPETTYTPENDAQVQSDIVRYLTARESYSAADLNQRFMLVGLLSTNEIAKNYSNEQSNSNPNAPVNSLGHEGTRTIHIEDIVFLDKAGTQELRHFKEKSQNLAKVDFVSTTTDKTGNKVSQAWVATISWIYTGIPKIQVEAWENWNGFTVTSYRVDPRNLSTTEPRS